MRCARVRLARGQEGPWPVPKFPGRPPGKIMRDSNAAFIGPAEAFPAMTVKAAHGG